MSYIPAKIHVTGPQLVKLWHGQQIQLPPEALDDEYADSDVYLHPMSYKKVLNSKARGCGTRIGMSRNEICHMGGKGWFGDAWNYLIKKVPEVASFVYENAPKVASWVKDNVLDSELYKTKIRPKVHDTILGKLDSLPYGSTTQPIAQEIFDYTGIGNRRRVAPKGKGKGKSTIHLCSNCQKKIKGGSFKT